MLIIIRNGYYKHKRRYDDYKKKILYKLTNDILITNHNNASIMSISITLI